MTESMLSRLPGVLFEIGKSFGSSEGADSLLSDISARVCGLMSADACSIMLLDLAKGRLLGKAAHGLKRSDLRGLTFRLGEGVAGWVAEHGEPALIDDARTDSRFVLLPGSSQKIRGMACVPLIARGHVVGVLTVTSKRIAAFTDSVIEVLQFIASTIALDLENVRLLRLSITDTLTGAYNREVLHERLPMEIAAADKASTPLAVAMVDIDHFKAVNDRFGHPVGDGVLAEVVGRIKAAIRTGDILIRYGGEEFLVLLPDTDATTGLEIAERMRARISDGPFFADDQEITIRASVGVAERRPGESAVDLCGRADAALYAAKRKGRDRAEVAT